MPHISLVREVKGIVCSEEIVDWNFQNYNAFDKTFQPINSHRATNIRFYFETICEY